MKIKILDEIRAVVAVILFLVAAIFFVPALIIFTIGAIVLTEEDRVLLSKTFKESSSKIEAKISR